MGEMVVYGDLRSGNCLKVKWTAERLGLPFRWVHVDIMEGGSRTPDFLALNPAGQVPTVVLPDGRTLAQSNAIILYLAEGSDLIPGDRYARGRMAEWMFWEQYSHEPYIAVARFQSGLPRQGRRRDRAPADTEGRGGAGADGDRARGRGFLVCETLSLADIALLAYTRMAHEGGFDLSAYPAVQAWVGRCEAELGL